MNPQPIPEPLYGRGQAIPLWRDERVLRWAAQILSAILVIGFLYWAVTNFIEAANQRGLSLGYSFLKESAGFPIGESVIPYDPSRSFAYAFYVGILNTLKVAVVGILLATILGLFIGLARLSTNWLVSRIALAYIELHRNIPLLVLLLIWYRGIFTSRFPRVAESIIWPGPTYLNQRGIAMAWPRLNQGGEIFLASLLGGIFLAIILYLVLERVQVQSGRNTYFGLVALASLLGLPALGWVLSGGDPIYLDVPVLKRFNFEGGMQLTPEFAALLVGLVTYTAAFIAEVVRAGIQAVSKGQVEAARSIGLTYSQILRLVVIPQALRVIIPPLISQYLNLTKNSSLAFFVGYPDLFATGRIIINQAGRAVPVIVMVMITYLAMSLFTSLILNIYNRRIQFVER
jgi:general L-amino acid transport system permease protein